MAKPPVELIFENNTISLYKCHCKCHDGYWLYDETRGMHLAVRAATEQEAFVETILYYQNRLTQVENAYKSITSKVDAFVELFKDDEEMEDC